MDYSPLIPTASACGSIETIDSIDPNEYLCRTCKTKFMKKQSTDHTPMECLSQRCEFLENEVTRLKDRDIKSRLQMKELENRILSLEDAVKGLTTPKPLQATPYSFGVGHKFRQHLKKAYSEDPPPLDKTNINYDNIIRPPRAASHERVGLFGSLGASSQKR